MPVISPPDIGIAPNVEVSREDRTESNKSIDIVVEGECFILGIEHKIDARVYNPFEEYSKRLEQRAAEKGLPASTVLKILLSLKPEAAIDLCGFKPIPYKGFIKNVEGRLEARRQQAGKAAVGLGFRYAQDF